MENNTTLVAGIDTAKNKLDVAINGQAMRLTVASPSPKPCSLAFPAPR